MHLKGGTREETGEEMFDQSVNLGTRRALNIFRGFNILNERQTHYHDIKSGWIIGDEDIRSLPHVLQYGKGKNAVNVLNMFQAKY